ncbi:hypothetical protein EON63_18220 [archaeon]|nr:MAG: hypothetical protein EON63_18220 [archaeon]
MLQHLAYTKDVTHQHLADDFDTPGVVAVLKRLVGACNKFMQPAIVGADGACAISTVVLMSVARYITCMMKVCYLCVYMCMVFTLTIRVIHYTSYAILMSNSY